MDESVSLIGGRSMLCDEHTHLDLLLVAMPIRTYTYPTTHQSGIQFAFGVAVWHAVWTDATHTLVHSWLVV